MPPKLAGDLPLRVAFGQVLPLVVGPLTAGQTELDEFYQKGAPKFAAAQSIGVAVSP